MVRKINQEYIVIEEKKFYEDADKYIQGYFGRIMKKEIVTYLVTKVLLYDNELQDKFYKIKLLMEAKKGRKYKDIEVLQHMVRITEI